MSKHRQTLAVALKPIAGQRFQPTGFPDLGAATFSRQVNGVPQNCLLVESAQSMANHLEATGWNAALNEQDEVLADIPHIRVSSPDGRFLTSSRLEAHRIASAYVKRGQVNGK